MLFNKTRITYKKKKDQYCTNIMVKDGLNFLVRSQCPFTS
jgi:hypothetical protein